MSDRTVLVVGGTSGIGLEVARSAASRGERVVITGRDAARATAVAGSIDGNVRGLAADLTRPETLADALADVGTVDALVLSAVARDDNAVARYDLQGASRLVTMKIVGYTETIHVLLPRMPATADSGIVVFGGRAKDRPYPGSTTLSTVNAGMDGLVRTLAHQIAPIRVNALHPGIVGDSTFWASKPDSALHAYRARTPSGRLPAIADVVDAVEFLLRNRSMTAASLMIDCGWEVT